MRKKCRYMPFGIGKNPSFLAKYAIRHIYKFVFSDRIYYE